MATQDAYQAILAFDTEKVPEVVKAEIEAGTDSLSILNDGLISAMDEVGKRFSDGRLFVPEMLMAAQAMKAGLEVLKPHLSDFDLQSKGSVVIGTVKGDLHDIGKNLVAMMMEGAGFKIIDLGVDVTVEKFVSSAKENDADMIALSALLTTTMPAMKELIDALVKEGMRDNVKVIVGGAPVTQDFSESIGSDGYSPNAPGAVELAKNLLIAK
jgi:5-methyltetrahydrofolate--homocysteine methyltransferase